ncbi:hypothetical protein [Achromobacter aloeverae]
MNIAIRMVITTLTATTLLGPGLSATAQPANYKNSREYKDAYKCGKESLESDPTGDSAVMFCVGNSHDPSKIEMQGFKDAVADARLGTRARAAQPAGCTFGYGVYQANGSHADGFEEGPQKITTMKMVAHLAPGREFQIFDIHGQPIPIDIVQQWFTGNKNEIKLTPLALTTCSKKQIG